MDPLKEGIQLTFKKTTLFLPITRTEGESLARKKARPAKQEKKYFVI